MPAILNGRCRTRPRVLCADDCRRHSPYDRYVSGQRSALSKSAQRELVIFRGKGNCTACHVGPTFTDERFHNTGVAFRDGPPLDLGRFAVSQRPEDRVQAAKA